VAAAAGQHNAPDGVSTHQAALSLAAINPMLELEESFFPIGIHVIGNRRSAERNRLTQDFPNSRV
jgi:hypothetical protein